MDRTRKIAGTCDDGPCPRIDETDVPGKLLVQGHRVSLRTRWLTRRGRSLGEQIIVIDESLLDQAAEMRGWVRP